MDNNGSNGAYGLSLADTATKLIRGLGISEDHTTGTHASHFCHSADNTYNSVEQAAKLLSRVNGHSADCSKQDSSRDSRSVSPATCVQRDIARLLNVKSSCHEESKHEHTVKGVNTCPAAQQWTVCTP